MSDDSQRVAGIVRHLSRMSQRDRAYYVMLHRDCPRVVELVGAIAKGGDARPYAADVEGLQGRDRLNYHKLANRPAVLQLIQNEATLSSSARDLFERVQDLMRTGDVRGAYSLIQTGGV